MTNPLPSKPTDKDWKPALCLKVSRQRLKPVGVCERLSDSISFGLSLSSPLQFRSGEAAISERKSEALSSDAMPPSLQLRCGDAAISERKWGALTATQPNVRATPTTSKASVVSTRHSPSAAAIALSLCDCGVRLALRLNIFSALPHGCLVQDRRHCRASPCCGGLLCERGSRLWENAHA